MLHTYIHTYMYTTYVGMYVRTYIHTYIRTTYVHTYIHIYIHTSSSSASFHLRRRWISSGLGQRHLRRWLCSLTREWQSLQWNYIAWAECMGGQLLSRQQGPPPISTQLADPRERQVSIQLYIHTYIHTYVCTCIQHTYAHTYIHTFIHIYNIHTYFKMQNNYIKEGKKKVHP